MAALPRLRPEAPALVTLRAAVDLGELLAVLRALAPAAAGAGLVAGRAVALGLVEVVVVDVLGIGACDDLLPVDGPGVGVIKPFLLCHSCYVQIS